MNAPSLSQYQFAVMQTVAYKIQGNIRSALHAKVKNKM